MKRWILLTVCVVLGTLLLLPSVASATFLGDNGKIACVSAIPGSDTGSDIGWVREYGGGFGGWLFQTPSAEMDPAWSPDGSKLAFSGGSYGVGPQGTFAVRIVNADGTGLRGLGGASGVDEGAPAWSPDGTKIVYETNYHGNYDLYVKNADGTGTRRLTSNLADDRHPNWSPDGGKIAFTSDRDGNMEIYVVNVDGSDPINLTQNSAHDQSPDWSPDGSKLLFCSTRSGDGWWDIYFMNADGSEPTRLTTDPGRDIWPCWSPDGNKIAYTHTLGNQDEIYVLSLTYPYPFNVSQTSWSDAWPSWQTLPVANHGPSARNDDYTVEMNHVLTVPAPGVLENDVDIDGDPLQVGSQVNLPYHGVLDLHADGSFTYTPDTDWTGTDSFCYRALDTGSRLAAAYGHITVTAPADSAPPTITVPGPITAEASGPTGAAVSFDVSATDDVDGDVPASADWPSGSVFPLGDTLVTVTATDLAGNIATSIFTVTMVDTTAPVIADVPAGQTVEATGPDGAVATWAAPTATDIVDLTVDPVCDRASGSTFPLGTTTVHFTATDAAGNSASASFTVTVQDTTPPTLPAMPDLTKEATGPGGATVTYSGQADDAVGGKIDLVFTPISGVTLPLGSTTVVFSATDAAGNSSSGSFDVTVQDTTAPVIADHANLTTEAAGPSGAVVTWDDITAADLVDGNVMVTYSPASGSTFALGTTTVTMSAVDAAGNHAADKTFTVTVQDTTPPVIPSHANITTNATGPSGAVVTWADITATDLVDGSVEVTCLPDSGTTFAPGPTTVKTSAVDAAGNIAHGSFTVSVVYAWTGFFSPVDNLPTLNVAKAGSAVPVKFSLSGDMGLAIFASGYPKSGAIPSTGTGLQDLIEETVTAGASSLRYDASADQYTYVWKTDKAWGGTCRALEVKLIDGTSHLANFKFTK